MTLHLVERKMRQVKVGLQLHEGSDCILSVNITF